MKRKSTWGMKEYSNPWTWVTLHKEVLQITQTDQFDYETEHNITLTSKHQINALIALLQAALLEYSE